MPFYMRMGKIPAKRHTQFRKTDGSLYSEQLFSTEGFSSIYSLLYHNHAPTVICGIDEAFSVEPKIALHKHLQNRSFLGFNVEAVDQFLPSRKVLMLNSDVTIAVAAPKKV